MSLKNFYSFEPGEALVVSELRRVIPKSNARDVEVFLPAKDVGVDVVLVNLVNKKSVSIQVKESVLYPKSRHFWFTIDEKKINVGKRIVDFYVFVLYDMIQLSGKFSVHPRYVIVSEETFEGLLVKKKLARGKYDFYFRLQDDGSVVEERDFTIRYPDNCLDNWAPILNNAL